MLPKRCKHVYRLRRPCSQRGSRKIKKFPPGRAIDALNGHALIDRCNESGEAVNISALREIPFALRSCKALLQRLLSPNSHPDKFLADLYSLFGSWQSSLNCQATVREAWSREEDSGLR